MFGEFGSVEALGHLVHYEQILTRFFELHLKDVAVEPLTRVHFGLWGHQYMVYFQALLGTA